MSNLSIISGEYVCRCTGVYSVWLSFCVSCVSTVVENRAREVCISLIDTANLGTLTLTCVRL